MAGIVHVVVFSNFEGLSHKAEPMIRWFAACARAHPAVRWTHTYNPIYMLVPRPEIVAAEAQLSPYLLNEVAQRRAEVGVHVHLFYEMVRVMGVAPRAWPYADDATPDANHHRTMAEDRRGINGGYDVLLTGYAPAERAAIIAASARALVTRGFPRPTCYCAGYSAADPALQAIWAEHGFTTSLSAQALGPKDYGPAWYKLLAWHGHITPLTRPYRVAVDTILPPPHPRGQYLDLVEVPLNMAVDKNDLYLGDHVVARAEMFDRHYHWARTQQMETAVAIGVHADVVAGEQWPTGKVAHVLDRFLTHVAQRARQGDVEVRYSWASEVGASFRENKTVPAVS